MFKIYKEMFKNLRDMQDQLWKESTESFPDLAFPHHLNPWQLQTLEGMSKWAEKAVSQSLELQQEWLEQWSGRADSKKLKPKFFADLNAEAHDSMQRWLDNQNQLWDQWVQIVRSSAGPDSLPNFDEWGKAIQGPVQGQMELLRNWSELADFEKMSTKELGKLIDQITKSMQKSIATQQRLWSHWFKDLGSPATTAKTTERAPSGKTATKHRQTASTAKKTKTQLPEAKDDLKQISGIGPGLEKKLNREGILNLDQIAKLSDEDIAHLEERIIRFPGRIKREKWVEQAKKLSSNK
ncbi:MAG: hypothetical protein ABFS45_19370 [Pseudomonadota bacterium]